MEKMREEFEGWFCSTIPYPIAKESWFAIMDDGDYIITDVQAAWAGWKASRAALCVELPPRMNGPDSDTYACGFDNALYAAEIKMEVAGVKYK